MSEKSNNRKKIEPKYSVKNRVRELREGLGISQEKLAEQMEVSRDTMLQIEKGQRMQADVLFNLAEFFGCSTDYILCRSDFRSPEREFIGKHLGFNDSLVKELEELPEEQIYMLNESTNANKLFSDTISAIARYAYHSAYDYPNIRPDGEKEKIVDSIELTTFTKTLQDYAWWYRGCVLDRVLFDVENDYWKEVERITGIKKTRA